MRQCIVFGAMPVHSLPAGIQKDAFIIAADAGIRSALALGLTVDLAVGDWDSAAREEISAKEIITLPHEKDDTDLHFAARCAAERGFEEVRFLGGIGGRLDHTAANFGTLRYLAQKGIQAFLQDEDHLCTVVVEGSIRIPQEDGFYLSVFSMDRQSSGVDLSGVYYPLQDAVLHSDFPVGTSNEFTAPEALVTVKKGALLIIRSRLH